MKNHTPGAWLIDSANPSKVYAEDGLNVCNCDQPGRSATEAGANAQLIASANKMLETLENIKEYAKITDLPNSVRSFL